MRGSPCGLSLLSRLVVIETLAEPYSLASPSRLPPILARQETALIGAGYRRRTNSYPCNAGGIAFLIPDL